MKLLIWIAVPLMLLSAAMLILGIGASGLWIALIALGIALVTTEQFRRKSHHSTIS